MKISTIFCSLLLALVSTVALTQTSEPTTGTLTVNGKAIRLGFVQAMTAQDWEMGPKNKFVEVTVVKVFLGDAPIEDMEDDFELGVRGKEGRLHGIQVTLNKKGKPLSGTLYHEALEGGKSSMFESHILFKPKVISDKTVSGKVQMDKPNDLGGVTYDFSATFSAPFEQEPKPTAEGPQAADTAPGKAVQEFLRATGARDTEALKRIFRKEFAEMLEKPEGKESVMGMLDQFYPADELKQIKIVRVFDFGNRAWVEGTSKRPSTTGGPPTDVTYRIRALRVNGEWKVQPM